MVIVLCSGVILSVFVYCVMLWCSVVVVVLIIGFGVVKLGLLMFMWIILCFKDLSCCVFFISFII